MIPENNTSIVISAGVIAATVSLLLFYFNSVIFAEENYIYFTLLLGAAALFKGNPRLILKTDMVKILTIFALLALYVFLHNELPENVGRLQFVSPASNGVDGSHIPIICAGAVFFAAASISYRRASMPLWLWLTVLVYLSGYIAINSLDFAAFKAGYHLSAGFVLISAAPCLFLSNARTHIVRSIAYISLIFFIVWLTILGARTAGFSLLVVLLLLISWQWIVRNQTIFKSLFWILFFAILLTKVTYIVAGIQLHGGISTGKPLLSGLGLGFLEKQIWTRLEIWLHVSELIHDRPLFGWGGGVSTSLVAPVEDLTFSLNRNNIASHSTFVEVLFRLGYVGLFLFAILLSAIWNGFGPARDRLEVQAVASFMLGILLLSTTSTILLFSVTPLRALMCWAIFGFGVGIGLRCKQETTAPSDKPIHTAFSNSGSS